MSARTSRPGAAAAWRVGTRRSHRGSARTVSLAVITLLASTLLAGCNLASGKDTAEGPGGESSGPSGSTATTPPPPPPVKVTTSLGNKTTQVPVDTLVAVEATDGTLRKVTISAGKTHLAGKVNRAGTRWTATDRLEPGTDYTVRTVAERADGKVRRVSSTFHSQDLTLDQQTYASVVPLAGETVGVGMPVIVRFDVPVTDKATIEKHLHVISSPASAGVGTGSTTTRSTGDRRSTGRRARTSPLTSTSTVCRPATASTVKRTVTSNSRSVTP